MDLGEFEAILVYTLSSRTIRATSLTLSPNKQTKPKTKIIIGSIESFFNTSVGYRKPHLKTNNKTPELQ